MDQLQAERAGLRQGVSDNGDGSFALDVGVSPSSAFGSGTREYDFDNGLRTAIGSTSSAAVALPTLGPSREVMLHASSRCFIRFGASDVAAAQAGAGQLVLEAGERFHIRVPAGVTHYRVIRDTADGFLNVTAVA